MSHKPLKVADLFCGAGGTSSGARQAIQAAGRRMDLVAVNHWERAIETHSRNHPDAQHHRVSLDHARPTDLVPGGRLDLLLASPECVHHSRARGGKPINDQSRSSANAVLRWCEQLYVRAVLVENVPEFQSWGPLDGRTLRPSKKGKGRLFKAWINTLKAIGYKVEWRVLNAADYGEATTRERLFIQARRDRQPIRWPAPTHSKTGSADLFGAGARRWRPAREIIDWNLKGKSIFRRKKPLSPKTLARIYAGAQRFKWPEPFLVVLRRHMDARSLDRPLPTITAGGTHLGVAQPMLLPQHGGGRCRMVEKEPLPTITTGGAHALVAPYYGTGVCHSSHEPLPTVTTRDRFGLVVPVTHGGGRNRVQNTRRPLPTITGANRGELAFITAAFGEREGQAPRVHSIDRPAPAICATGRLPLVQADTRKIDILFRMLQPHELAAAMGFEDYEFSGNKTERVKQIGNAVPVRLARALVSCMIGTGL